MTEYRFPSFGYAENRLRSTALRSLLLAYANRKHKTVRLLSVLLILTTSFGLAFAQAPPVEDETDTVQAEEQLAEEAEAVPDLAEGVELDPAVEARADEEFNPDEEISEDYPIPLPSDI